MKLPYYSRIHSLFREDELLEGKSNLEANLNAAERTLKFIEFSGVMSETVTPEARAEINMRHQMIETVRDGLKLGKER